MFTSGSRNPSESKMKLLTDEGSRSVQVLQPAIPICSTAESEVKTGSESVSVK